MSFENSVNLDLLKKLVVQDAYCFTCGLSFLCNICNNGTKKDVAYIIEWASK